MIFKLSLFEECCYIPEKAYYIENIVLEEFISIKQRGSPKSTIL